MNSARKATLSIVATVALAGSLAGCSVGGSDNEAQPTQIMYQAEGPAVIYTNADNLITKYINYDGTVEYDEGHTPSDAKHEAPARIYDNFGSVAVDDTIEIEGTSYSISSQILISFAPLMDELIPVYNEFVAPKVATTHTYYTFEDFSIQQVVAGYVQIDILNALESGELPKVQHVLNGEATVVTHDKIAQAQLNGVSARDAYETILNNRTSDEGEYEYSNSCASYGVEMDGTELATALAVRFPNVGATFSVDRNVSEVRTETEVPCDVVDTTPGTPVKDPLHSPNPDSPNTYITPPED